MAVKDNLTYENNRVFFWENPKLTRWCLIKFVTKNDDEHFESILKHFYFIMSGLHVGTR